MLAWLKFSDVRPLVVQGLNCTEIHSYALAWRTQAAKLAFWEKKNLQAVYKPMRVSLLLQAVDQILVCVS